SSSVIRSPEVALSRISATGVRSAMLTGQPSVGRSCDGCSCGLDEAELRHRLEEPGVAGELEERVEAGPLARAEAVAELLEVARKETRGIAVPLGRLVGELLGLRTGEPHRSNERVLELREPFRERLGAGPDREHHGQPRALE